MAITGPSSYVPTTEEFISHWTLADAALGVGNEILLKGSVNLAALTAKKTALVAKRTLLQDKLTLLEVARGDIDVRKQSLLGLFGKFVDRVRSLYAGTKWERALPIQPGIGAGLGDFTDPLDAAAGEREASGCRIATAAYAAGVRPLRRRAMSTGARIEDEAGRILQRFGGRCRAARVAFLANSGGFSGARLWRVTTPAQDFCLRAVSRAKWDPARLRGLHRLLKQVFEAGVAVVPVPVATEAGTTVVESGGELWQLEPWLPGVADFERQPTNDRLAAAMTCLARWHRAAERFEPQADEAIWFARLASGPSPGVAERLERIRVWDTSRCELAQRRLAMPGWSEFQTLGRQLLDDYPHVAPRVVSELRIARDIAVPLQPCLRDVWHDHVLFTGAEVTGLIDAHACRTESVAADIARLLGSLLADDRDRWQFAIDVYQQLRPLSVDERGLIEVFDRSGRLLNGLTWLDWICLEGRSIAAADRPRIIDRVARHVTRLAAIRT